MVNFGHQPVSAMPWSRKLREPFMLDDGRTFLTLRDAAEFMLRLPEAHRDKSHWQDAADAMLRAAQPAADMSDLYEAEARLHVALQADGVLGRRG